MEPGITYLLINSLKNP